MSDSPFEVIDIVAPSGEGARIRQKDFAEWSAKGFVRGTVYPAGDSNPPADTPVEPEKIADSEPDGN